MKLVSQRKWLEKLWELYRQGEEFNKSRIRLILFNVVCVIYSFC